MDGLNTSTPNPAFKFIVGAYVASISLREWNEADETRFYASLRRRLSVRGLEHAFYGRLHRYDDHWFLRHIDPAWEFVITTLPGMVELMATDEVIGLASTDDSGRNRAVEFMRAANHAVQKLNAFLGRPAVIAVQVHSAPAGKGSVESLAKSLATIGAWDWHGAKLVVEHCDAFRPDGQHAKGFLPLADEIRAVLDVRRTNPRTALSMMLNWGRSVVEGRSTDHILTHIAELKKENLLSGFIFSGTTASADSEYGYFGDKHAPPPTPHNDRVLVSESLMTEEAMRISIDQLPLAKLDYLGFKIMPRPLPSDSRESMVYIDYMLSCLSRFTHL